MLLKDLYTLPFHNGRNRILDEGLPNFTLKGVTFRETIEKMGQPYAGPVLNILERIYLPDIVSFLDAAEKYSKSKVDIDK